MANKALVPPKAILAGVVTAALICGGMLWLDKAAGTAVGFATWFPGLFFGATVTYALANLSGTRKVANASAAERDAALAGVPPPGQALVYVYRQGFVGRAAGLDLSIDGRVVAQLKAPRFACVAVPPGAHRVTVAFGGLAGPQNRPDSVELIAEAGHAYAYRAGVSMGLTRNAIALAPVEMPVAVGAMRGIKMVRPDVAVV